MNNYSSVDELFAAVDKPDQLLELNPELAAELTAKGKTKTSKSKYGNVRCEWDGMKFDSKKEMARYGDLRLLELTGQISNLRTQPVYELPSGVKYKGDFEYIENGQVICEEVKGFMTDVFKLKWKQVKDCYKNINFILIGAK